MIVYTTMKSLCIEKLVLGQKGRHLLGKILFGNPVLVLKKVIIQFPECSVALDSRALSG